MASLAAHAGAFAQTRSPTRCRSGRSSRLRRQALQLGVSPGGALAAACPHSVSPGTLDRLGRGQRRLRRRRGDGACTRQPAGAAVRSRISTDLGAVVKLVSHRGVPGDVFGHLHKSRCRHSGHSDCRSMTRRRCSRPSARIHGLWPQRPGRPMMRLPRPFSSSSISDCCSRSA